MVLAGITKGRCHGRIEACKGGAFLVESISTQEILIPEDFTEEQRLVFQKSLLHEEGE
jgi:hypothetical protein